MPQKPKLSDLVWAKMKGYIAWPGQVVDGPEEQIRKGKKYIFFYGTENFAWVKEECIYPHPDYQEEGLKKIKSNTFKKAVSTICELYDELQKKDAELPLQKDPAAFGFRVTDLSTKRPKLPLTIKLNRREIRRVITKQAIVILKRCDRE